MWWGRSSCLAAIQGLSARHPGCPPPHPLRSRYGERASARCRSPTAPCGRSRRTTASKSRSRRTSSPRPGTAATCTPGRSAPRRRDRSVSDPRRSTPPSTRCSRLHALLLPVSPCDFGRWLPVAAFTASTISRFGSHFGFAVVVATEPGVPGSAPVYLDEPEAVIPAVPDRASGDRPQGLVVGRFERVRRGWPDPYRPPAYPRYNRGLARDSAPSIPNKPRAPVGWRGRGVAPLPPVTAHRDG